MYTAKRKTGRPKGFHRLADGSRVEGLVRLKDGRWRVSGPEKITFTEPDEWQAVARFNKILADRIANRKTLIPMGEFTDASEAVNRMIAATKHTFVARIPTKTHGPIKVSRSF